MNYLHVLNYTKDQKSQQGLTQLVYVRWLMEERKVMFYIATHSTHSFLWLFGVGHNGKGSFP